MTVTITRRIWITLESLAKDTRQSGNKQRETGHYIQEVSGHRWKQSGAGQTLTMAGKQPRQEEKGPENKTGSGT